MISKKDMMILSSLRKDARMNLTKMARKTGIPVSTIFDKIKGYKGNLVTKHTTLINFDLIGYNTRAKVILKVKKEDKTAMKGYLFKNQNVNSFYRVNNGYDFMFEAVFRNLKETEEFIEAIEEKFGIIEKQVFYITEDVKRESFMEEDILFI
ncbi:MAG: Lrp/AsnC family transcriptional regulator [Nanoarchaeota archaeon]|nr:Lrp/AsnC family transcriptional regulator [Nanoarchaeota archaeon]